MCDRDWNSIQQSECDEPPLEISKAVILEREGRTGENLLRVHEIDSVVLEVLQTFRFVPLEPHIRIVYTILVNARGSRDSE